MKFYFAAILITFLSESALYASCGEGPPPPALDAFAAPGLHVFVDGGGPGQALRLRDPSGHEFRFSPASRAIGSYYAVLGDAIGEYSFAYTPSRSTVDDLQVRLI